MPFVRHFLNACGLTFTGRDSIIIGTIGVAILTIKEWSQMIDVVVPDGSMQEVVTRLLAQAGLVVSMEKRRTKEGTVEAPWIKRVAFQRPQEIPIYLNRGHFDVAIVGEDWIANWGFEFPVLLKIPIGRGGNKAVRIVLAVSNTSGITRPEELPEGSEVATEYVQLTQNFFSGIGRQDIRVVPSYGNTEHKVGFGATAIVDVTESGTSLRENELEIIHEIMVSHTVVVANVQAYSDDEKRRQIDCLAALINGAVQASGYVKLIANVPVDRLESAKVIIGGLKGPSCVPISDEWLALESIVPADKETDIIFRLLQEEVTDIIVERNIPLVMS